MRTFLGETQTPPCSSTARPARAAAAALLEYAWIPVVLVGLVVIYAPGLGNALVFDDSYLAEGLFADYAQLAHPRVRMLSYGSFVWLDALFGDGWWKQRIFNLLLHLAVTLSLWGLYRELLRHIAPPQGEPAPAVPYYRAPVLGLCVGFFALNPVAVYGVGYLIQRSIVMATLFTVVALWLFARGLRTRSLVLMLGAVAAYALAIASKEHTVLAPLAAAPLLVLVRRPDAKRLAMLAAGGVALVALAAAVLYQRYGEILGRPFDEYSQVYLRQLAALSPDAPRNAWPLSIMNEAWLFFVYGVQWLVPYTGWMSINLRPPFPVTLATFPQCLGIVGYVGLMAGASWLLLRFRDGRALLGISLLIPGLLFGTEFATVWVQDPIALYRSYLWAIGIPGVLFYALHGPAPRVVLVAGLVLAALLGWQASDRVRSLASTESVWTDAIEKLPRDPRAVGRWIPYLNRGTAYAERGEFGNALRDFERSSALGDQGIGVFNIGSVLSAHGRHRDALSAFNRAQSEGYDLYNLPVQRGMALLALGQAEEAWRQLEAGLAVAPPSPTRQLALLHLGRAGMQLGRLDAAIAALEQFLAVEARHSEARYLLGMALVLKGEHARALPILDALVREDASPSAFYARSLANFGLRRKQAAMADLDEATRRGLKDGNTSEWRARIAAMP